MDCCEKDAAKLDVHQKAQRRTLYIVLGLNAFMFVIEGAFGLLHHSTGLLGDSLDMLGDAFMYGLTLAVINRGKMWQARASLVKGLLMGVLGLGVVFEAIHKLSFSHVLPIASTMGAISFLALATNVFCAWLLAQHRSDNLNMKSVWLCSRNDALSNVGVMISGALVSFTHSAWPDAVAGIIIAIIVLKSAAEILQASRRELGSLRAS